MSARPTWKMMICHSQSDLRRCRRNSLNNRIGQANGRRKLLRTFAAQTEALQRYRGKGQQKVTVEHVHVHTGGQAMLNFCHLGEREDFALSASS